MLLLKTIVLQITNNYHYKQDYIFKGLLDNLNHLLQVLYKFDNMSLFNFIDYFTDRMLDEFIYIYKAVIWFKHCISEILYFFINKIFKLTNHRREILLAKFRKWFILIVRGFVTYSGDYSEESFWQLGHIKSCLRIYMPDWFVKGETMGIFLSKCYPGLVRNIQA